MSAPLQNRSLDGSIDNSKHPVGTWSSGSTLGGDEGPPVRSMRGGLTRNPGTRPRPSKPVCRGQQQAMYGDGMLSL